MEWHKGWGGKGAAADDDELWTQGGTEEEVRDSAEDIYPRQADSI